MTLHRTLALSAVAAFVAGAMPPLALAAGNPPPIPAEAQEDAVWFAVIDGQQVGPLTEGAIVRRMEEGSIRPDTLVWRDGMASWTKIAETHAFEARRIADRLQNPKKVTPTDNRFLVSMTF